jgi:adenine-specific DNA-methyltransferase
MIYLLLVIVFMFKNLIIRLKLNIFVKKVYMLLSKKPIEKSLNKAFLKQDLTINQMDIFITNLKILLDEIDQLIFHDQDEENFKTPIINFLKNTYYKDNYYINSSKKYDLIIGNGPKLSDHIAVIIETKRPSNTAEMIDDSVPNAKALHELVHYYMQERLNDNDEIKYLIATNCYKWYIFDAVDFENLFFKNNDFKSNYKAWNSQQTVDSTTKSIYEKIKDFIDNNIDVLEATYFDLKDYKKYINSTNVEDLENLISLYKILSPEHLLKKPFANDSNTLNKEFYNELLYIIGLEEKIKNGKIIIDRKSNKNYGSLIENTINILITRNKLKQIEDIEQYGDNVDEQIFSIALELCITWLNRILFLKLLEGQLIKYHNGDTKYAFLSIDKVKDFDTLDELFFEVFAVKHQDRSPRIKEKYEHIPYLNSSLFEINDLEHQTISIANLKDDLTIPIYSNSVLKNTIKKNELNTLDYLLIFLSSYNFSSDSHAKIQKDNKTIINAAVLGLIFEKINGYRDGSYFTPGFITMYISRQTIRRAVVKKFRENENIDFDSFDDVKNYCKIHHKTEDIRRFNSYINSIKICDPAVGSGHFLVSALNELIAIKSELNILADDGILIDCEVSVDNDELIVINKYNKPYEYYLIDGIKPSNEAQQIQRILFNEKAQLIENCLFGVDINTKSVLICRLRLWIELLKNAYYIPPDYKELETLPNIDINIKCGDSLVSRFNLIDSKQNIKKINGVDTKNLIAKYKKLVVFYKSTTDKDTKQKVEEEIKKLKEKFSDISDPQDPDFKKLREKQSLLNQISTQIPIGFDESYVKAWRENLDKLIKEVSELQNIYDEKQKTIYKNAFEWRFEFPEVLNDDGDYVGFDAVIGNPPYIQLQKAYNDTMKYADLYKTMNYETFDRTGDIYCLFYERGIQIAKDNGILCYISSNKWMRAGYGEKLRNFFLKYNPLLLLDLGPGIFESATVDTCIMMLQKNDKSKSKQYSLKAVTITKEKNLPLDIDEQVKENAVTLHKLTKDAWFIGSEAEQKLKEKIEHLGKPLKDWDVKIYRGVLTGLNEAFIIDDTKRQEILDNCKDDDERRRTEAIIKPILRGRDIKRYYYEWAGLWVIGTFPALHLDIDDYPAIKKYLLDHFDIKQLEQSGKKYPELGFNARKKTGNKWFETQDQIAYYPEFEKEKVVYSEIVRSPQFYYDTDKFYIEATSFLMTGEHIKYICGLLNSKPVNYFFKKYYAGGGLGKEGYRYKKAFLEKLPIPPITPSNQHIVSQIESLVDKILAAKKTNHAADTTTWEKEIDQLVYQLYDLTDEEIGIVEGVNEVNIY